MPSVRRFSLFFSWRQGAVEAKTFEASGVLQSPGTGRGPPPPPVAPALRRRGRLAGATAPPLIPRALSGAGVNWRSPVPTGRASGAVAGFVPGGLALPQKWPLVGSGWSANVSGTAGWASRTQIVLLVGWERRADGDVTQNSRSVTLQTRS